MSSLWIGGAAILVGAATSLYGANAQKKAIQGAANTNADSQDKINNAQWTNWLMTRGIQPTTPVVAGETPTAGGYTAVNTRLPLWANVNYGTSVAGSNGGLRLVKKGTPTTTGIMGLAPVPAATPVGQAVTNADGSTPSMSAGSRIASNVLDPLNLAGNGPRTIGSTAKRTLDPLGLFG